MKIVGRFYEKTDLLLRIAMLIAMVIIIVYTVCGELFLPSERDDEAYFCSLYESTWTQVMHDGSEVEVSIPAKLKSDDDRTIEMYHTLPTEIEDSAYLVFRTAKQDWTVSIDDQIRKEYSTTESRWVGSVSPTYYMFVKIGPEDTGKTIRVKTVGTEPNLGDFIQVYYANYGGFWQTMIAEQGRIFVIGVIMMTLAFVAFILSLVFQYAYGKSQKLASLSLGVIIVSVWIFANSAFRQLIFDNVSVIGDLAFLMVILLPIPYADYMNQMLEWRYKKLYYAVEALGLFDFVLCVVLYVFGIRDFSDMFLFMAFVLFITILLMAYTMIRDMFSGEIKKYWISACAIVIAMVICIIQVLNYLDSDKPFDISIATIGLFFMLVVAVVDTFRDMVAANRERNDAVLASETKSRFLANMSHEIRTPINAVLGMNELILKETNEEQIRAYATDVDNSGHTLLALINDILDFSKIESGKLEIVDTRYDLREVLDKVVLLVAKRAQEKNLDLRIVVNPLTPRYLQGDPTRVQQIIVNLLTNAIKYTDEGFVELKVDFEKEDDNAKYMRMFIFVSDTGRGIREEDAEKLFSSFQRVDEDNNRNIEGTGLGLAITKRLVDLMHGEVGMQSKFGEGSCFWVHLDQQIKSDEPIADYQIRKTERKQDVLKQTWLNAKGVHILAVDDVPMNLKVLAGFLKRSGMTIDMCTSGAEAIEAWQQHKYDLVLLDHMMPLLDGVETAKIMWSNPGPNKGTPIIMLTANAITGVKEQYLGLGFADYLSKPYSHEQLREVLCRNLPEDSWEICTEDDNSKTELQETENVTNIIPEQTEEVPEQNSDSEPLAVEADDYIVIWNEKTGLEFCGGNREFFDEMLQEFARDNELERIEKSYAQKDWKAYRVAVHALKGISLTFGFEEFSKEAKELELATKDENYAYIDAHHATLINHYKKVLAFIEAKYN